MRRFISLRGRERIYTFTFSEVNDPREGTERTLCTGHEKSVCEKKNDQKPRRKKSMTPSFIAV